jgi:hypothetical protein
MTQPEDMIDRIVAGVLDQLRLPADAAPRPAGPVSSAETPPPAPRPMLELRDGVITAALLEERGISFGPIVIGAKSVLTPSAIEFLAKRKVDWRRVPANDGAPGLRGKWLVIVTRSTPAVSAALDSIAQDAGTEWNRELAGCHREAATRAVGALCRGECDAVVVFTGKPEAAVCRANRNPNVRAAAVTTVTQVKTLRQHLGANLFAVDPAERTAFELRSLLRELGSAGKPAAPSDWNE